MTPSGDAYGLWWLAIVNSAIFVFFAFSFTRPKTKTDWRGLGAYSALNVVYSLHTGKGVALHRLEPVAPALG